MQVRALIGSGDKIGIPTVIVLVVGLALNVMFPSVFSVGGPGDALRTVSIVIAGIGIVIWLWAAVLVLLKVPKGELITTGPFAWMKHPIYTSVALLVAPWIGFLLNTWLGAAIGVVLYVLSRRYAPEEEAHLAETFGARWETYERSVRLPWL